MSSSPPDRLDPWQLCDRQQVVAGRQALARFPRLAPLLASTEGEVAYELAFRRDHEGRAVIDCCVEGTVRLTCQRCLSEMPQRIQVASRVAAVVGIDEGNRLPDGLEPLLIESGSMVPMDLVEDELLLALPAVPRHAPDVCDADGPIQAEANIEPEHPFSVLAGLKAGKKES